MQTLMESRINNIFLLSPQGDTLWHKDCHAQDDGLTSETPPVVLDLRRIGPAESHPSPPSSAPSRSRQFCQPCARWCSRRCAKGKSTGDKTVVFCPRVSFASPSPSLVLYSPLPRGVPSCRGVEGLHSEHGIGVPFTTRCRGRDTPRRTAVDGFHPFFLSPEGLRGVCLVL